ncbi:MAG: NHL repeat-containing protein [Bacillota bacterium]
MLKFFAAFILLSASIFPQEYDFLYEFGNFKNASAITVNPAGMIYIADKTNNEIYKFDTEGRELKSIGGYGWDEAAFDSPEDVSATVLYVFVADRNNHRIQILDKDLNFLSQIKGNEPSSRQQSGNDELRFGYPVSCVTSTLGDIFILDSENRQIIKLNTQGQLVSRFGNYQSGDYELNEPKDMTISPDNKLLVLDKKELLVFDQYGNGVGKIKLDMDAARINIAQNSMVLNSENKLYISALGEKGSGIKEVLLNGYDLNNDIVAGLKYKDVLYVLTSHQVAAFKEKKAE